MRVDCQILLKSLAWVRRCNAGNAAR